ncbi:MAG: exosortase C-terminal domain/associated protein EpsI [Longimicrobiales bacterium]
MTRTLFRWAPAALFLAGAGLVTGMVAPQLDMPLQAPLDAVIPMTLIGLPGEDQEISESEARVAGFDDYLLRTYAGTEGSGADWVSLYVGYYESQTQGRTIHSPKNCLPGSGWEPLQSTVAAVPLTDGSAVQVNRYILQRENERALVLYWYQGRGRVAHNEYAVKYDLLKDAALRRRTDEALVRVVVPVTDSEDAAFARARAMAEVVIPALEEALPAW